MRAFFFAPEDPRRLALVRIGVGLVLLYDALLHWRPAIELYSTFGPALPVFAQPAFHAPVPGPSAAVLMQTALIFSLACVVLGWQTRTSLWLAFVLSAWLGPLDIAATFTKYSVLGLHLLALLGVSGCGTAWPRRLMQILLCSVYLGAALTKIRSPAFANGDLLTYSLLDDHWGGGRFGLWLATLPHVPLLLSLAAVAFEMIFPCLVWVRACRLPILVLALVFHGAMTLTLHVGIFGPLMMVALLAFLDEREVDLAGQAFRRLWGFIARDLKITDRDGPGDPSCGAKSSAAVAGPSASASDASATVVSGKARFISAAVYLLTAAIVAGGGLAIQRYLDDYGAFGRTPVQPLPELRSDDVDLMLAQQLPAYEDYFQRIELGSRVSGNQVFGAGTVYRIGQRVYVLAELVLPHPSMHIEGLLITPDGQEAARFSHRLNAAFGYAINGFELTDELEPGPYRIILQAEGYEVAQRRFELAR